MTISNPLNSVTIAPTGSQTAFNFPFVADSASDLVVTLTSANSVSQTLSPSAYTVTLGATPSNQIWPLGGTVTLTSAPTLGSFLTIARVLPYEQNISIQNQGNYYAQVTEQALDILQMQIQQLAGDVTAISAGSAAAVTTPYVFVCGPVGGTANALTVSSTQPPNFSLNNGTFITFQPTTFNAPGPTTLNVLGTGNIQMYRLSPNGPTPVTQGDIIPVPLLAQYLSSLPGWFVTNDIYGTSATTVGTATNLSINTTFLPYITTAPVTFTVAQTTTLPIFWYNEINANGGAATIQPNAADSIVVNGSTLSQGVPFTITALNSAKVYTDGNGHIYLNYLSPSTGILIKTIHSQSFSSSGTYTPTTGMLYCQVQGVGGGGGGGGSNGATAPAGGGGYGEYAIGIFTAAQISTSQSVTIGAGGIAGSSSAGTGGNGGITALGSLISIGGGIGGAGNGNFANGAPGGLGGSNGTGGIVHITGQSGGYGWAGGVTNLGIAGYGGSGRFGAGGQGVANTSATSGLSGTGFGSGGSGGNQAAGSSKGGGPGTSGYILIIEYCSQ